LLRTPFGRPRRDFHLLVVGEQFLGLNHCDQVVHRLAALDGLAPPGFLLLEGFIAARRQRAALRAVAEQQAGKNGGTGNAGGGAGAGNGSKGGSLPTCSDEAFEKKKAGWRKAIEGGKSVNDLIAMIQTKELLTDDQKMEIASWATEGGAQQ
jgi:hypothetical protein